MKITILGAGAWGTALARLLHQGGNEVTLWGHVPEWLDEIRKTGRNDRFLPGVEVPREVVLKGDLGQAVEGAERMQTLINGLLAYSRVGTRGGDLKPMSMQTAFDAAINNLQVSLEE